MVYKACTDGTDSTNSLVMVYQYFPEFLKRRKLKESR